MDALPLKYLHFDISVPKELLDIKLICILTFDCDDNKCASKILYALEFLYYITLTPSNNQLKLLRKFKD